MSGDPELNPYAPPADADASAPFALEAKEGVNYEEQRQSVLLCFILSMITVGIYPCIWMIQRRPFLESLRTRQRLGMELPLISLVASVVHLFVIIFTDGTQLESLLSLASGIPMIMACFRARTMIEQELVAMGRPNRLSGAATFFFSVYYLQWRINQLADVAREAPEPAPKRKKKKKKTVVPAAASPESPDTDAA